MTMISNVLTSTGMTDEQFWRSFFRMWLEGNNFAKQNSGSSENAMEKLYPYVNH